LSQQIIQYIELYSNRYGVMPFEAASGHQSILDQLPEFLIKQIHPKCLSRTMLM
jgi:tRNA A37 threonylcarbamoyltransferase TsaD